MITLSKKRPQGAVCAMVVSLLAGCSGGGGGGGNNAPPPSSPTTLPPGDTLAVTSANRLVSFNRATPTTASAIAITGLRAGENIVGMDLRPGGTPAGQLIAIGSMGGVYSVDPSSGMATMKSTMTAGPGSSFSGLMGTRVSIDTNNLVDQLRVVSDSGQNLRVMVDTGATFTDTPMTIGGTGAIGVTEVAYTNNFASACRTTVYYLDTTADRLLTSVSASGGVLTAVGGLQVNAAAMAGFDIVTGTDGTQNAIAALTVGTTTSLYTVNLTTGAATVVGAISGLNSGESILGLAGSTPTTTPTQPVGELLALTDSNNLVSFNSAFAPKLCTNAPINGLQGGESVLGIDMRPSDNNLYALTSGGRLYTVNQSTGTVALRATLTAGVTNGVTDQFRALDGTNYVISVSPVADQLRVVSDRGTNLRVNLDTGATFTDTALSGPASTVTAGAYTNSFAGTGTNTLYEIDTANDRLVIQGRAPANASGGVISPVGSLGITGDVNAVAALDINAVNNNAVAALSVNGATTSDFYSVNLLTGAATRVNSIGATGRIRAMTYSAVPVATLTGVTQDNRLVTINATNPGTFASSTPISGMQGGEQTLGFDMRPSNGLLYLLTDAGRIYIVDPVTAMARLQATMTPNQLSGTTYGVDFSPTADALRVISDAEQNLAVVVDTGQVIVATPLTRIAAEAQTQAPDVIAIAYTNNYAGTAVTTLYDIDRATNTLLNQSNPNANAGVLSTVGSLGTQTFQFSGSFDIVGGDSGLAIAALQPTGATQSTLYRVNLLTGALTAVGAIGPTGTAPLMGLTVRLR